MKKEMFYHMRKLLLALPILVFVTHSQAAEKPTLLDLKTAYDELLALFPEKAETGKIGWGLPFASNKYPKHTPTRLQQPLCLRTTRRTDPKRLLEKGGEYSDSKGDP